MSETKKSRWLGVVLLLSLILTVGLLQNTKNGFSTSVGQSDILPAAFLGCKVRLEKQEEDISEALKSIINGYYGEGCNFALAVVAFVLEDQYAENWAMDLFESIARLRAKEELTNIMEGARGITPDWQSTEGTLITSEKISLDYKLEEASVEGGYVAAISWQRGKQESRFGPTIYAVMLAGPPGSNMSFDTLTQFIRKTDRIALLPLAEEEPERGKLFYEVTISDWKKLTCGTHDLGEYVVSRPCTDVILESIPKDFILEVDVRDRSVCRFEPGCAEYGIIIGDRLEFRIQEPNGAQGEFKLSDLAESKTLLDWTESAHIKPTCVSYNHLKIARSGSVMWLYVNDQLLDTYYIELLSNDGSIKIFSGSDREIRFSNLRVYSLKKKDENV